jgi:hypothetical protein
MERVLVDLRLRRRDVRAELGRLVEIIQGLVLDDRQREREERSTPQLAPFQRRAQDGGERQG